MPSLLARVLPILGQVPTASSSSGSHVTDAPEIERVKIGPAANHLHDAMMQMYWAGVRRELPYIILTLRRWRTRDEFAKTVLPDEEDIYIHGYDTFLDQVSHTSRKFGNRYRKFAKEDLKKMGAKTAKDADAAPSYTEALEDRGWDIYSEMQSDNIRHAIKIDLQEREYQEPDVLRRRARMLLQSAQFLDIDKIIEYREPEAMITFWKQPSQAQITVSTYDESCMPVFVPQLCFACDQTIRGSMFRNIKTDEIMCEGCYRKHHYGHADVTKVYKQCCLRKAVSARDSQEVCSCINVRRRDSSGRLRNLFPVDNDSENSENHLNPKGTSGKVRCGLYELTDMVAEAKFASTQSKLGGKKTLESVRREDRIYYRPAVVKNLNGEDPSGNKTTTEFGNSYGATTKGTEDVPFYLSDIVDEYPYGNVHMALRVGPLVIENGVSK